MFHGPLYGHFQTAAAGHLHAQDVKRPDVVEAENLAQLFRVVHVVQLGTALDGHMALHEVLVDGGIGKGGAVSSHQQSGSVKVGSLGGHELDLGGPLAQLAGPGLTRYRGGGSHGSGPHPGAAGRDGGRGFFRRHVLLDSLCVIGPGLPLPEGDGVHGTGGEAVSQTIAVVLPDEDGFALPDLNGAFVTGGGAQAAAIACVFVDMDNFANHGVGSPE